MAKESKATATRHLAELLEKGCIVKQEGGGRSTWYSTGLADKFRRFLVGDEVRARVDYAARMNNSDNPIQRYKSKTGDKMLYFRFISL